MNLFVKEKDPDACLPMGTDIRCEFNYLPNTWVKDPDNPYKECAKFKDTNGKYTNSINVFYKENNPSPPKKLEINPIS